MSGGRGRGGAEEKRNPSTRKGTLNFKGPFQVVFPFGPGGEKKGDALTTE